MRRATQCSSAAGADNRSGTPPAASSAFSATGRSAASPPEVVAQVLWLTPFPPAPATSAGAGRMFELIRRLAAHHRVDVLSFAADDELGSDATRTLERAGARHVRLVPRQPDRARLRDELARRRGPVRALLAYRYLQMLRYELSLTARFDLIVAIAEAEARELRERGAAAPVAVSPMGVDTRAFPPAPPEVEEPGLILLVGFFGHAPNVDAARWFVGDVLPRVRVARPAAHVALVGREPPPAVRALAEPRVVEVTGFVPDLRPWLARAQVVVVPVREGGGVRGKLLEAWAAARPVVATARGVAGLAARDGENVLVHWGAAGALPQDVRPYVATDYRDRPAALVRELRRLRPVATVVVCDGAPGASAFKALALLGGGQRIVVREAGDSYRLPYDVRALGRHLATRFPSGVGRAVRAAGAVLGLPVLLAGAWRWRRRP